MPVDAHSSDALLSDWLGLLFGIRQFIENGYMEKSAGKKRLCSIVVPVAKMNLTFLLSLSSVRAMITAIW
jgi:hypothetical protein